MTERSMFRELVERSTFTGSGSVALGLAVSRKEQGDLPRHFVGTVVDVGEGYQGVWVRRTDDPADTSVWYSVDELDLATEHELALVARQFLARQYREVMELRKELAK